MFAGQACWRQTRKPNQSVSDGLFKRCDLVYMYRRALTQIRCTHHSAASFSNVSMNIIQVQDSVLFQCRKPEFALANSHNPKTEANPGDITTPRHKTGSKKHKITVMKQ